MPESTTEQDFRRFTFIALFGFVAVFAAFWLYVVFEPKSYLGIDYDIHLAKRQLTANGDYGRLTVLGDSCAMMDIVPKEIGSGVVNLGLNGATSIETYYLAQEIVQAPSPPKAVIIGLNPYEFVHAKLFWTDSVAYGLLSPREVQDVYQRSRLLRDDSIMGAQSPGDLDVRLKMFLYSIKFPAFYFASILNSDLGGKTEANQQQIDDIVRNQGGLTFDVATARNTTPDLNSTLTSFVPSKLLDDYFDRTLALFQTHNIPVYFLFTPCNEVSTRLYWSGLKPAFVRYLSSYADRYPNFHLLGEPLLSLPSADFIDESHLNRRGATEWTSHVVTLLNDTDVEGGPFGGD